MANHFQSHHILQSNYFSPKPTFPLLPLLELAFTQGDVDPPMKQDLGFEVSQGSPSIGAEVHGMVQGLLRLNSEPSEFKAVQKSSFAHSIS